MTNATSKSFEAISKNIASSSRVPRMRDFTATRFRTIYGESIPLPIWFVAFLCDFQNKTCAKLRDRVFSRSQGRESLIGQFTPLRERGRQMMLLRHVSTSSCDWRDWFTNKKLVVSIFSISPCIALHVFFGLAEFSSILDMGNTDSKIDFRAAVVQLKSRSQVRLNEER